MFWFILLTASLAFGAANSQEVQKKWLLVLPIRANNHSSPFVPYDTLVGRDFVLYPTSSKCLEFTETEEFKTRFHFWQMEETGAHLGNVEFGEPACIEHLMELPGQGI